MVLSQRLQFIYENLLTGEPVWDFCCDHGYLGIEALKAEKFGEVYFVDQVPHIVNEVEKWVIEKFPQFHHRAHFKNSKGEEIQEVVQGTVVIAGVGAFAIFKILESLWRRNLLQAKRIILCPQRDEKKFLAMLEELGETFSRRYFLREATTITERARFRVVYVLDHADDEWPQAAE